MHNYQWFYRMQHVSSQRMRATSFPAYTLQTCPSRSYWKPLECTGYDDMLEAIANNIRGVFENVDTTHTLLSDLYDKFVAPMYVQVS